MPTQNSKNFGIFFIALLSYSFASSYSITLHPRLRYDWDVDYNRRVLNVKVTYNSPENDDDPKVSDWVAVGFSDYGDFNMADFCVFWSDWRGHLHLQDVHTEVNDSLVVLDKTEDCLNFQVETNSGPDSEISFTFSRPLDTCDDNEDYVIEEGTTHILWSFGKGPLYKLEGLDLATTGSSSGHGFSRVRLLKVNVPLDAPEDTKMLDIRHKVMIPSDDTTYWCSIHKLPEIFSKKHHVIQYEPIITPGNEHLIHHMEVFNCIPETTNEDFPMWQGPCGSDDAPEKLRRCKKVLAAWAIGATPFTYPKEAGLPIGGPDSNPYVMLEVHLNNEQMESGVRDNSGLRFLVTESLRANDAGIIELGLIYTDRMAIPPGQYMYPLNGYCLPACTAVGFPSEGITLFGSQLHTHSTGLRVATKHFRMGAELPEVNRDNHYSTHFQEIRVLREPRLILPGDELITTCWFDTRRKTNATLGGFSFSDEMCLNYIHYFPKTEDLEICKSSVDTTALQTYFKFLKDFEGESTDPDLKSVADNYHSINWSQERAEKLWRFYDWAPAEMQCTSGAGEPLPGKWTDMAVPPVVQKLKPEPRPACEPDSFTSPVSKRSRFAEAARRLFPIENSRNRNDVFVQKMTGHQFNDRNKKRAQVKRVGQPMNEMRRKRYPQLDFSNDVTVQQVETDVENAMDLLDRMMAENDLSAKKRRIQKKAGQRRKKSLKEVSVDDVEKDVDEALELLDDILSSEDLNKKKKRTNQNPQILNEDLDGEVTKKKKRLPDNDESVKLLESQIDEALQLLDQVLDNNDLDFKKRGKRGETVDLNQELDNKKKKKRDSTNNNLQEFHQNLNRALQLLDEVQHSIKKRGQEMSQKKKRFSEDDYLNNLQIDQLESNVDEALGLLDQVISSQDLAIKKRSEDNPEAEILADQMLGTLAQVHMLLKQMGVSIDETQDQGLLDQRKKKMVESLERKKKSDYSDEWSDYDTWGYDRKRRGLGSMMKKRSMEMNKNALGRIKKRGQEESAEDLLIKK